MQIVPLNNLMCYLSSSFLHLYILYILTVQACCDVTRTTYTSLQFCICFFWSQYDLELHGCWIRKRRTIFSFLSGLYIPVGWQPLPPWLPFTSHTPQIDFCIHQGGLCKDPERDNPWDTFTLAHSSTSHPWPKHVVLTFSLPAVAVLCAINTTVMFHNKRHSFTDRNLWEVPLGKRLRDMVDSNSLTRF